MTTKTTANNLAQIQGLQGHVIAGAKAQARRATSNQLELYTV